MKLIHRTYTGVHGNLNLHVDDEDTSVRIADDDGGGAWIDVDEIDFIISQLDEIKIQLYNSRTKDDE